LALHNTGDDKKAREVLAQVEAATPATDVGRMASIARVREQLAD